MKLMILFTNWSELLEEAIKTAEKQGISVSVASIKNKPSKNMFEEFDAVYIKGGVSSEKYDLANRIYLSELKNYKQELEQLVEDGKLLLGAGYLGWQGIDSTLFGYGTLIPNLNGGLVYGKARLIAQKDTILWDKKEILELELRDMYGFYLPKKERIEWAKESAVLKYECSNPYGEYLNIGGIEYSKNVLGILGHNEKEIFQRIKDRL